jgi:tRNA dimethylallyltransferase
MASVAPLIVITGPTASGKSSLALELAEKWGGEIICADSRTIYKGMDIGTAKPSAAEQKRVRHWALDVVEPGERFTVVDFQGIAFAAIEDIRRREKIPFLVGGTGLYIDAVVLNFVFGPNVDKNQRAMLETLSTDELVSLHMAQHMTLPDNDKNKRYLIRNIEKYNTTTSRNSMPEASTCVVAIQSENDVLKERIRNRIEGMFEQKVMLETQQLIEKYGPNSEAMTGNVYRIIMRVLAGELSKEAAVEQCMTRDWQLAKRQTTWLKRHDYVQWLKLEDARVMIESLIQKYRDA